MTITIGVVSTNSRGLNDDAELYDDMNAAQFDAIPASQMHRLVDLEIVKADKQGTASSTRETNAG